MWIRNLLLGATKTARWGWKSVKGGSFLGRTFGVAKASKWAPIGRVIWRTIDVSLTAYAVYDIFWGDTDSGKAAAAQNYIHERIVTPEIALLLEKNVNDTKAIAHALRVSGVKLLDESIDGRTITGMAYMGLASYIEEVPSGTRLDAKTIKDVLSSEMINFVKVDTTLTEAESKELTDSMSSLDFEDLEMLGLRKLDFLCYMLEGLMETATGLNPTNGTTIAKKEGGDEL